MKEPKMHPIVTSEDARSLLMGIAETLGTDNLKDAAFMATGMQIGLRMGIYWSPEYRQRISNLSHEPDDKTFIEFIDNYLQHIPEALPMIS
jgi:hypothetical protein